MSLETVSNDAVAICLDNRELSSLGLNMTLSDKAAREIVMKTLKSHGESPWSKMEVELFSYNNSLLLLARPARSQSSCFVFKTFEDLITAANLANEEISSAIIYFDNVYHLVIHAAGKDVPVSFFEFGQKIELSKSLYLHIKEHGEIIMEDNAIKRLKEIFIN